MNRKETKDGKGMTEILYRVKISEFLSMEMDVNKPERRECGIGCGIILNLHLRNGNLPGYSR